MNRLVRASAVMVAVVACGVGAAGCSRDAEPSPTVTVTATATVTAGPIDVIEDTINSLTEFEMPDLVGANLQEAQDTLQGLGSFLLNQEDASGEGRWQIDDSNWKVCSQEPAPGVVHSKLAIVTLASVKNDEACP